MLLRVVIREEFCRLIARNPHGHMELSSLVQNFSYKNIHFCSINF